MRSRFILVAVCCAPTAAVAADFGAPPAPYSWTGVYFGLNGGLGWDNTKTNYSYSSIPAPSPPGFETVFGPTGPDNVLNVPGDNAVQSAIADGYLPVSLGDSSGTFGAIGAQFGYNYQMQQVVIGFEADLDWADGVRSANFVAPPNIASLTNVGHQSAGLQWLGTARLRAGYAFDRALIFATGGVAFGGIKAESSASEFDGANTDIFAGSASGAKVGYALGGGVEYAFAANMSLKAEYLYYDLGKANYTVAAANTIAEGEGLFVNASQRLDGSLVRIGLNVRY
jgi:outer membrane immunogenic protein